MKVLTKGLRFSDTRPPVGVRCCTRGFSKEISENQFRALPTQAPQQKECQGVRGGVRWSPSPVFLDERRASGVEGAPAGLPGLELGPWVWETGTRGLTSPQVGWGRGAGPPCRGEVPGWESKTPDPRR